MSRNTEYSFIDTDAEKLEASLVSVYEQITGITTHPASPERLFLQWICSILIQERALANYAANQNLPSRAEGDNLDALGDLFYGTPRPEATHAVCTMRFSISQAQASSVLIPSGTQVTDTSGANIWETTEDAYVAIGDTFADVLVQCKTAGTAGNGYAAGQINKLIDLYDYYSECANITMSDGGSDRASDEEYYDLLRTSMDSYSCAGARDGYIYFAKKVSTEIADVVANSPSAGEVAIYVLMNGGSIASEEMKAAVLDACNSDEVRPLTDQVFVLDAETVPYNIAFSYYVPSTTTQSAAEIATAVQEAVAQYAAWQCARLGRDINPSYLISLLMQTGIKRVELTAPAFTVLRDGKNNTVPQVAALDGLSIINGGYEDE